MAKAKIPPGLYRRRRRDGSLGSIWWCAYYSPNRAQPIQESTGTDDLEEAKRYLFARRAENPTARAARLATKGVTVNAVLDLVEAEARDDGKKSHHGRMLALRHALGAQRLADVTRAQLDALCREWRSTGIDYPERDKRLHRLKPVSGATCNRIMATLRYARRLAIDKLNVDLPRLTFPHFEEHVAGRYVSPEEFHGILSHVSHPTKRAFVELLYLTAIRPGQLKSTETSNVRVEKGRVVALVYRPDQVKQRMPHEVPLVGRAQEVVAELWKARQLGCRLLFHIKGKPLREMKSEWHRACQAAGIVAGRKQGGIVLYNLRHSCLTNLAAAGVPDSTARAISGHKTDSAHRRYIITQSSAKAAALAAMTDVVEAARSS